jgi:hypothetical protein
MARGKFGSTLQEFERMGRTSFLKEGNGADR